MKAGLALGISRSRLCQLRHEWLAAGKLLTGSVSRGNQRAGYPPEVTAFILRYLTECRPLNFAQLSYELEHCLSFRRVRATLPAYATAKPGPKPRRLWQRTRGVERLQHGQRFWIVETLPDHRKPLWPTFLAEYNL